MKGGDLIPTTLFLLIVIFTQGNPISARKVRETQPQEDVRDAFLVSRQKAKANAGNQPARPAPRRPGHGTSTATTLGIGYSLYQKDPVGQPARVSTAKEFHQDDAVRLVIESNMAGYLYIFHTENGDSPQMLFPDARLNSGNNRIEAHVPYETPSSRESNPRLRWFVFNEKPAIERLYLIVTKQPLPNIPTGKSLVAYCQAAASRCPWRPAEANWKQVSANSDAPVRETSSAEFGQRLTAAEAEALERGLGLKLDAPAPAVIRISQSPQAKAIVAIIALNHK